MYMYMCKYIDITTNMYYSMILIIFILYVVHTYIYMCILDTIVLHLML